MPCDGRTAAVHGRRGGGGHQLRDGLRKHERLPRDHHGPGGRVLRHGGKRGHVAGPDVLRERGAELSADNIVWLHPEWSQHSNPEVLNAITEWIKSHGAPYRAGWQLHKNYAADLMDQRSAPAAPLGGNLKQGF